MPEQIFDLMAQHNYEHLFYCQDQQTGLKAIIAIHNTTLGPAAGGIRMWPYESEAAALHDALRLARAMTYKWAASGMNMGGGKCVVIGDPKKDKSEQLLRTLARAIQRLHGLFLTGLDVGTTVEDMEIMRQESRYVVTVSEASGGPGDSAPATALGVVEGMRACAKAVYGSPDLRGKHVLVQGVGAVGHAVVERLTQAGAMVTITDIDQEKLQQVAARYHAQIVVPQDIYALPIDIYSPCALGAVLNDQSIPQLRCRIVCGSANNQLAEERHGEQLTQREIIYAPDYIVNAGGAISSIDSFNAGGFQRQRAEAAVARIYNTMEHIIALSQQQHSSTNQAANLFAEQRLRKHS